MDSRTGSLKCGSSSARSSPPGLFSLSGVGRSLGSSKLVMTFNTPRIAVGLRPLAGTSDGGSLVQEHRPRESGVRDAKSTNFFGDYLPHLRPPSGTGPLPGGEGTPHRIS